MKEIRVRLRHPSLSPCSSFCAGVRDAGDGGGFFCPEEHEPRYTESCDLSIKHKQALRDGRKYTKMILFMFWGPLLISIFQQKTAQIST